jgi:hypothetical protein
MHVTMLFSAPGQSAVSLVYGTAAIALYYGDATQSLRAKTHPAFLAEGAKMPQVARALWNSGVQIVHGHFRAQQMKHVLPNASNYMVWLREPTDRVISHYAFLQKVAAKTGTTNPAATMSLIEFAKRPEQRNLQSRLVQPLKLQDVGFVGVTERMDEVIALMGCRFMSRANKTDQKPDVSTADRAMIATLNADDYAIWEVVKDLPVRPLPAATYIKEKLKAKVA